MTEQKYAAIDAAIDLDLLVKTYEVGREKVWEAAATAADETHGDYERVVARLERLDRLIEGSDGETYEERLENAVDSQFAHLADLIGVAL
ncbi:MAG TPA: hypothetical protein VJT84_04590 [Gaiellaceae bacterium]|nr:hypothetical protein [Gaiellaceae bacterium]